MTKNLGSRQIFPIFVASGSPSTIKWNCKCAVMDKVRLKVRTVLVQDLETHETQTLYSVFSTQGADRTKCASGMTLRDAITSFCDFFSIVRNSIELIRPFLPQGWEDYGKR